jgi:hypothetical protein
MLAAWWRWQRAVATRGWSGTKKIDVRSGALRLPLRAYGRRPQVVISSTTIEARTSIALGGPKYAEFEIEPTRSIDRLVYGEDRTIESKSKSGGVSKRSTDGACKASGSAFAGSNPASPIPAEARFPACEVRPEAGAGGQAIVNQKRRVTLPRQACIEAGLQDGDRLRVRSECDGRVVLERVEPPPAR